MKLLLAIAALVFVAEKSSAYDVEVDGIYYNIDGETKTASVTSGTNRYAGDVVIPESFVAEDGKTYTVTSIGSYAFNTCSSVLSVKIPDTVTDIAAGGFYHCNYMTSIEIPGSVTSIGDAAFEYCGSLTKVVLPETLEYISYNLFKSCTNLESVNIPSSVKTIGGYAFHGCGRLQSLDIPQSVESIGTYAFYACSSLQSLIIPESVESIGTYAIGGCSGLTSVTLPSTWQYIVPNLFTGCSALEHIVLPPALIGIGEYAFRDCRSLREISIPNSVTTMGMAAFLGCSGLSSVKLSESITSIEQQMFSGCSSLEHIEIPVSVVNIGSSVFSSCSSLTEVVVPNTVKTIGSSAFYNCSQLVSVKLSDSITELANDLFAGCTELLSVSIPGGVTKLYTGVFDKCTSLKSITIPSSVTSIGAFAFRGCTGLTSVDLPDSVTELLGSSFYGCSALKSVKLPSFITYIESGMFEGCSSLESIDIPATVKQIGNNAFRYCSSLTDIHLPQGMTYIGQHLFNGCTGLTSIEIPSSVVGIQKMAFYNCSGLQTVTIPPAVTYIEESAFYGCGGLKSIDIPPLVTRLPSGVFQGCSELEYVFVPISVTYMGDNVFQGCGNLKAMVLGNAITSIGWGVFTGCGSLDKLFILGSSAPTISWDRQGDIRTHCTLYVPEGSKETYEANWSGFQEVVEMTGRGNGLMSSICEAENMVTTANLGYSPFQYTPEKAQGLRETLNDAQKALVSVDHDEWTDALSRLQSAMGGYSLNKPGEDDVFRILLKNGSISDFTDTPLLLGDVLFFDRTFVEEGYAQYIMFTPVDGMDCYVMSAFLADKQRYYVSVKDGAFCMSPNQEEALVVKVVATKEDGIHNLVDVMNDSGIIGVNKPNGQTSTDLVVGGECSSFRLVEAVPVTIPLRITEAGYATLMLPYAAECPCGLHVYSVSGADAATADGYRKLILKEEEVMAANTPYIIKGTEGEYSFTGWGTALQATYTAGFLTGTFVKMQAPYGAYVLQNNGGVTGFYHVGWRREPTMNAYRAYLSAPAEGVSAETLAFVFDDTTTGIESPVVEDMQVSVYTVSGEKVRDNVKRTEAVKGLSKGIYIIKGRKVMVE